MTLSSLFLPAEDVAGDYFDLISISDDISVICIADVTGHGVPAAMNAMMLKVLVAEACDRDSDPTRILEFVNRRLTGVCRTDGFVTMFVARLDTRHMVLQYASAGHEHGLLLRGGELLELRATGMVLGVLEDQAWCTEVVSVRAGDRLLLVTDGVTEARNATDDLFCRERLAASFVACQGETVVETVAAIGQAVRDFCEDRAFLDDVTLLALEITPGGSRGTRPTDRAKGLLRGPTCVGRTS